MHKEDAYWGAFEALRACTIMENSSLSGLSLLIVPAKLSKTSHGSQSKVVVLSAVTVAPNTSGNSSPAWRPELSIVRIPGRIDHDLADE